MSWAIRYWFVRLTYLADRVCRLLSMIKISTEYIGIINRYHTGASDPGG